jgi:hypothetical protein
VVRVLTNAVLEAVRERKWVAVNETITYHCERCSWWITAPEFRAWSEFCRHIGKAHPEQIVQA